MIPEKIILIRPDHLGDLILSLPVAETLKKRFTDCAITYLAAKGPASLGGFIPYVDNWIIDQGPDGKRLSLLALINILRDGNFDCLIELKPSWRTALAGFLARVKTRIGTSRRLYSIFYNRRVSVHRRASRKHQTDLELELLIPLGIDISGISPSLAIPDNYGKIASGLVGKGIINYIVIHPGSQGSAPNWPTENYRKLADIILKQTDFKVVITGVEKDISIFEGCINLCGKTSLAELACVIAGARLFISGSTGTLHLADALGTRCISFFTGHPDVDFWRWGPRRNLDGILNPPTVCNVSNLSSCSCLESITPELAYAKFKQMVSNSESRIVGEI
jgi:heptosyltransferase III